MLICTEGQTGAAFCSTVVGRNWNELNVCKMLYGNVESLHNAKMLGKPEVCGTSTHCTIALLRNLGCSLVSEYTVALRRASQVKKSCLGVTTNCIISMLFVDLTSAGSQFQRVVAETETYLDSKFVLNL